MGVTKNEPLVLGNLVGLKPWPPTCAGEAPQLAKVWRPQACQGDLLYLRPTASGCHPPQGDRQTVEECRQPRHLHSELPLLPPLGLLLAAAAAYIRNKADGSKAARPSPKHRLLARAAPSQRAVSLAHHPSGAPFQQQPGSKEPAGGSTEEGVLECGVVEKRMG